MTNENRALQSPEAVSETREELILNSLWHFMPAVGDAAAALTADWGTAYVPGAWYRAG